MCKHATGGADVGQLRCHIKVQESLEGNIKGTR